MSQVEEFLFHAIRFCVPKLCLPKAKKLASANWSKSQTNLSNHIEIIELGNLQYQKFKTQFDTYSKFTASSSRQLPSRVYFYSSLVGFEWIETKEISSWNIKFRFSCKMKTSHSRKQQMKKGLWISII
jgi:hypothetical protein